MIKSTTPGHIYFLGEKDYLSGEESHYIKIGLVRDDKPTEDRIKEHQTGNPRKLVNLATLPMRFVEHAETLLHYHFGEQWITGEWFKLSEKQFDDAVVLCDRLLGEQDKVADYYAHAQRLKTTVSNGALIGAREEDLALHQRAVELTHELKIINGKLKICKNQLLAANGNYNGIEGILDVTHKDASTTWDEKSFKEAHPDLHLAYCEFTTKVSGSFKLQGTQSLKQLDETLDASVKASKPDSIAAEDILKDELLNRTEDLELLHLNYIQLNKDYYATDWKLNQVLYQIQSHVSNYEEVEGVAKWKREEKESAKLNKKALFAEHPEMEEKYTIDKPAIVAYQVRNWREY